MKVRVAVGPKLPRKLSLLAVPVWEGKSGGQIDSKWSRAVPTSVMGVLRSKDFAGQRGQRAVAYPGRGEPAARVVFIGLGPLKDADPDAFRRLGGIAGGLAADGGDTRTVVLLPTDGKAADIDARARYMAEGIGMGVYRFDRYRSTEGRRPRSAVATILLPPKAALAAARTAAGEGIDVADGVNLGRDIGNIPGNDLGPEELADLVKEQGKAAGLKVRVLNEKAIEKEGMGALLSVAQGSARPARFIVMEHRPKGSGNKPPLVYVGKAITFDTGGISLKGREGMEAMKFDLGGGAAVAGALCAIGRLEIDRPVIGLIASAENMPGGKATRPGDVVTSASGLTIEILNTDAEGRLVLADALHYAKRYDPALVVDLATLTGACMIALGRAYAGLFTPEDSLRDAVLEAAEPAGEKFWPLPLGEEYVTIMKGTVGDLRNSASRWGGASLAAAFLSRFIEGTPWVHLDIAPTGWTDKAVDYQQQTGATGFGVRTLVELAEEFD